MAELSADSISAVVVDSAIHHADRKPLQRVARQRKSVQTLELLRKVWVNLDLVWAAALVATGAFVLFV